MIKPIVTKHKMAPALEIRQNLEYWLGKTPQERLEEVDRLRRQLYGDTLRLQRTVRVIQRQ